MNMRLVKFVDEGEGEEGGDRYIAWLLSNGRVQ